MTTRPQVDSVYEQLRSHILGGSLEQGADLNERSVADLVGTSRTPVREAVARLVVEGLAEKRGRKTQVTVWTDEKIGQLYEMRALLESDAARLAAMRRSEHAVAQLEASLTEQKEVEDNSPAVRRELNYQFHRLIWRASANPFLLEANEKYGVQSMSIVPTTLRDDSRWEKSLEEHHQLVEFISTHQADDAAQLMRQHLESAFRQR
ncbi:GntR family transcriptional regulator [Nesterenkonia ebinurensis]|uniref:GntR family transcriptional regulator n=1 Tax=Nesterenkonia ebinurensis TaxID=2608252 RepID=UPI00123D1331|nr:GntR family transcriptional regulator [Nesterenkonia ebinurensis]